MTIKRRHTEELPEHPDFLWKNPSPKKSYDVIVIGAGGHGLATAYYLAKNFGITNVAVLEKGYLAGGNMGRNTTIIRSNYLWDESAGIYEKSLQLWEGLEEEVGYEMFFDQRGVMTLAHSVSDLRSKQRNFYANAVNDIDSQWLTPEEVKKIAPIVNISPDVRYPDLIQGCEVKKVKVENGKVIGVDTNQGFISANKVAMAAAGHTSVLSEMAGFRVPLQSRPLQALVSELLEHVLDTVIMSGAVHVYVSQAHKGELVMGAGTDAYNSYAQRGGFHVIEHQLASALELFPIFSRAHLLRTWGGIVDIAPDASPILGLTPVEHLYINSGWGTGGFKATPGSGWAFADTIAHNRPHDLVKPYSLDRFVSGHLIDEHGAAGVAH